MASLPPELERLLRANPLKWDSDQARVLAGDLEFGARRYAQTAEARGEALWSVWWEIQRVRDLAFPAALAELNSRQKDRFLGWCLQRSDLASTACDAYAVLLRQRGAERLHPGREVGYLRTLLRLGRNEEVIREVDWLLESVDDWPEEESVAVHAELALRRPDAACARAERIRERHHDDGRLWAHSAMVYRLMGRLRDARLALGECAKLGVYDDALLAETLDRLKVPRSEWERLHRPWEISRDPDHEPQLWCENPGATLNPTHGASPHAFGGEDFH